MHVLAVNSVTTLLNYLSEQLANTPPEDEIKAFNKMIKYVIQDRLRRSLCCVRMNARACVCVFSRGRACVTVCEHALDRKSA